MTTRVLQNNGLQGWGSLESFISLVGVDLVCVFF